MWPSWQPALAIAAGFGLTRRIVRPLAELGETAGRIADGELDLRADVVREDEIGALARSFNRMTGQLGLLVSNLRRHTERLRAIDETGRQISSILELDELLPYVAKSMVETFGYEMVRMFLSKDCCAGRMVICARGTCSAPFEVDLTAVGLAAPYPPDADRPADALDIIAMAARTEQPVIPGDGGLELAVPIRIGDRLAGVLDVVASETRPLDEEDVLAARTIADQLAMAIENSRLYEQATNLAANQERQRLARDLHDAVSQTLFSVSLIAEVLPRIYARDPEQGAARLEELRQLTRGALAEMRTLLLELRPAALAEAKLTRFTQAAGRSRHRPGPYPGGGGYGGGAGAAHRGPTCVLPHRPGGLEQRRQALRRRQGEALARPYARAFRGGALDNRGRRSRVRPRWSWRRPAGPGDHEGARGSGGRARGHLLGARGWHHRGRHLGARLNVRMLTARTITRRRPGPLVPYGSASPG